MQGYFACGFSIGDGVFFATLWDIDSAAVLVEHILAQRLAAVKTDDGVVDSLASVTGEVDVEHGYMVLFAALAVVDLRKRGRFIIVAGLHKNAFHGCHAVVDLHLRREC